MDRPILFSGPMIRAIIREIEAPGTGKTQTRRIVKPRPWNRGGDTVDIRKARSAAIVTGSDGRSYVQFEHSLGGPLTAYLAPCAVGDRLWVREAWKPHSLYDHLPPREMPVSRVFYLADDGYSPSGSRGRPGIHMPRARSRLTLHVTDVRVERLQDISEEDAMAEGIVDMGRRDGAPYSHCIIPEMPQITMEHEASTVFASLWEHINGDGSWRANPWILAISFRPVLANIDAEAGGER